MEKETLEEAGKKESKYLSDWEDKQTWVDGFIEGAKWQQERSYSDEEVESLLSFIRDVKDDWDCDNDSHKYGTSCRCCDAEKTLEQFKKK